MRFPIRISAPWRPLFALFGFHAPSSVIELDDEAVRLRFGTAYETVPLAEIAGASVRRWPFYYGLGPKLGPDGGVSYVGSTEGVVRIDFVAPRTMSVWGPFRTSKARCVNVSLEDPDGFLAALDAARTGQRVA